MDNSEKQTTLEMRHRRQIIQKSQHKKKRKGMLICVHSFVNELDNAE
jgi:hypothetical protein